MGKHTLRPSNIQKDSIVFVTNSFITADEVKVVEVLLGKPLKALVKSQSSGELYEVAVDFECYKTKEDAEQAFEKYKSGYKPRIL